MPSMLTHAASVTPRFDRGETAHEGVQQRDAIALRRAAQSVVHHGALSPRDLSEATGISYSYLLRAANPNEPDVQCQARWVPPITRAQENDALIKAIAEQCGGVFYRLGPAGSIDIETAKSLKEFSEYLSAAADAQSAHGIAGRTVEPAEYYRAKAQAMDAIAAILSHVEGLRVAAGVAS